MEVDWSPIMVLIVLWCGHEKSTPAHIWWLDTISTGTQPNHHHQLEWLQWNTHPKTIPDHQWWEYVEIRWLDLDLWMCGRYDQSIIDGLCHGLCRIYPPTQNVRYNDSRRLPMLWMWSLWLSPKWRPLWLNKYTYPPATEVPTIESRERSQNSCPSLEWRWIKPPPSPSVWSHWVDFKCLERQSTNQKPIAVSQSPWLHWPCCKPLQRWKRTTHQDPPSLERIWVGTHLTTRLRRPEPWDVQRDQTDWDNEWQGDDDGR